MSPSEPCKQGGDHTSLGKEACPLLSRARRYGCAGAAAVLAGRGRHETLSAEMMERGVRVRVSGTVHASSLPRHGDGGCACGDVSGEGTLAVSEQ